MRAAKWMALAAVGMAPLVALAQSVSGTQAGPTGAASIERGQDTAGAPFTTTGQPAGGAIFPGIPGLNGVPLQGSADTSNTYFGTGGSGFGTGSSTGATYYGTTPAVASPSTPVDTGTAQQGAQGSAQTGGTATGSTQSGSNDLSQRVDSLEREVSALRGTGGSGAAAGAVSPQAPVANTQAPANTASADTSNIEDQQLAPIIVEFDGRVRDVTSKYVEVVDNTDGTVSRLRIDDQTRVFKGSARNRISMKRLAEGARVRTSFTYVDGVELARDIVVLSPARRAP